MIKKGKHEIYFKSLSNTSMAIMEEYGLRVFRFCDKIGHLMRFFFFFFFFFGIVINALNEKLIF